MYLTLIKTMVKQHSQLERLVERNEDVEDVFERYDKLAADPDSSHCLNGTKLYELHLLKSHYSSRIRLLTESILSNNA